MSSKSMKEKANWNSDNRKLYVELAYEQVLKGNRSGMSFTKEGWKIIINEFNQRAKTNYNQKQIKNHHNTLKDDWKLWEKMKNISGFGYDPIKHIVTIDSEQVLEEFIKAFPDAKKFRSKPPEYVDLIETIFTGKVASGGLMWAPDMGRHQGEGSITIHRQDIPPIIGDARDFIPDSQINLEVPAEVESGDEGNQAIGDLGNQLKRKIESSSSSRRPRKESKGVGIYNHMNPLSKYLEFKTSNIKQAFQETNEKYDVVECLRHLKELPGMERGSELKFFAIEMLQYETRRKTFMELVDDPEECVQWINAVMEGKIKSIV